MGDPPAAGQKFDARYEILGVLGTGGLGTVYKARQLDLNRIVALKVLHAQFWQDQEFKTRFQREAQTLNKLSHSNIVRIYHLGVAATGQAYLAMELVEGKSLRQLLNELDRLPVLRALKITRDAALALSYVHENGIIHRDLKPENMILIDRPEADTVKLIDFGLARIADSSKQSLTKTGDLIGTATYMSPEQCKGLKADERSDIYSLAACLYELLTGKKCYDADTPLGVLYKHLNEPPPLISASMVDRFTPSLNNLIGRSMEKDPQLRLQTMAELAAAIDKVLVELETIAQSKRLSMPLAVFLLIAAITLAGAGLFALRQNQSSSTKPEIRTLTTSKMKELEPPETVHIPLHDEAVSKLAEKYKEKMGSAAVITILSRWEKIHGESAPIEDRMPILAQLTGIHASLDHEKEAEYYAGLLFAYKSANTSVFYAATSLKQMYCRKKQPEKGIAIIQQTFEKCPYLLSSYLGTTLLAEQAQCYMDLHDYTRANKLLQQVEKLSRQATEIPKLDLNHLKYLLLTLHCRQGNKERVAELIHECTQAAQKQPEKSKDSLARAYWRIGLALVDGGEIETGLKYVEKAEALSKKLGQDNDEKVCAYFLADTYMRSQQFAKALSSYQYILTMIKAPGERSKIFDRMYDCASATKDPHAQNEYAQQSIHNCEEQFKSEKSDFCLPDDIHYTASVIHMSDVLLKQGKQSDAEKLVADWISKVESKAKDSAILAGLYQRQFDILRSEKRGDEALASVDKAIEVFSNPEVLRLCRLHGLNPAGQLALAFLSKAEVLMGNPTRMNQALISARLALASKDLDFALIHKIDFFLRLGRVFTKLGKPEEAEQCFAKAESLIHKAESEGAPQAVYFLFQLAQCQWQSQQPAQAERLYRECSEILSKRNEAESETMRQCLIGLGAALRAQHHKQAALSALKQSLLLSQKHGLKDEYYATTQDLLGATSSETGDYRSAEKYMKEFIAVCKPEELRLAYFKLACNFELAKEKNKSIATVEQGIEKTKNLPDSAINQSFLRRKLAQLYYGQHRTKEAESQCKQSIESALSIKEPQQRDTELAFSYSDMARIMGQQGRNEEACKLYNKSAILLESLGKDSLELLKEVLTEWLAAGRAAGSSTDTAAAEKWLQKLHQTGANKRSKDPAS